MVADGADLRQPGTYYGEPKSPLDWIAEKRSEILKAVIDSVDVHAQDDKGNTILHKVCAHNVNFDAEAAKEVYCKAKLLLDAGADPSITNDKDETALMLAQQDNLKVKTVELLMMRK